MISEKDSMPISVPLVGALQDSVNALVTSGLVRSMGASAIISSGINDVHKYYESEIAGCVNHLLYLCSDEPDMPDHSESKERRTHDITGAAKRSAIVTVGARIGAALRNSKYDAKSTECVNAQSHSSPIPHMRRAHWHHFWTGPRDGERKLIIKWLPPISVSIESEELQTAVRKVHPDFKEKNNDI